MRSQRAGAGLLQGPGGTDDQVILWQGCGQVFTADDTIRSELEVQRVAPVNQHEYGLQQVVAVGTATGDVQKQVQLGGCRDVVERLHGRIVCGLSGQG